MNCLPDSHDRRAARVSKSSTRLGGSDATGGILKQLEELRADFYAGRRSAACPLVVNDSVRIIARDNAGTAVISIEGTEPEPTFLVELGYDGSDHLCRLSQLRFASVHGGMTVNERLYAASVMKLFDEAVRDRDRTAMIRILRLIDIDPPESTADPILEHPEKYGY